MVTDNLKKVIERMENAAKRAGRNPEDITLIAVSKTKPVELIKQVYDAGIREFGENKVQEIDRKSEVLPKDIKWHMIGHLQRNKVKTVIREACLIHSVDSLHLAETIHKESVKKGIVTQILLEDVARSCPEYGLTEREIRSISSAAALHDIGKIAVPDAILNKPSQLTDEEFDIMKQHTVWGRKILEGLEFLPQADCGASYHHERFDGKGYPAGLKGGQLPEMVWIISVADALDAMGSDRCYRGHCDRDYIIGEFRKLSGTQFEPAAVKAVVELLESGEIAVQ